MAVGAADAVEGIGTVGETSTVKVAGAEEKSFVAWQAAAPNNILKTTRRLITHEYLLRFEKTILDFII